MKWDVKHDRAKKVIDQFLDNAGYWQESEYLVAGLTDEEAFVICSGTVQTQESRKSSTESLRREVFTMSSGTIGILLVIT